MTSNSSDRGTSGRVGQKRHVEGGGVGSGGWLLLMNQLVVCGACRSSSLVDI